jgi:hypothetical protein
VAPVLAMKAALMPSTTGRSMPIDPMRSWLHAARYSGCAENRMTGSVSTRLAIRISCSMSAGTSPGAAKYSGTASIITCIMPSHAIATRSSSMRRTRRSSTGTRPAS